MSKILDKYLSKIWTNSSVGHPLKQRFYAAINFKQSLLFFTLIRWDGFSYRVPVKKG